MEAEYIWNAALTIIMALFGMNWKSMKERIDMLEKTHNDHKNELTHVQINYVHKTELKDMRKELMDRFDRLEDLVAKRNMD
jgi:Tfp pilus assembly protein PilO